MALFDLLNNTINLIIYISFLTFGTSISLYISYVVIQKTDDVKVEPFFWIPTISYIGAIIIENGDTIVDYLFFIQFIETNILALSILSLITLREIVKLIFVIYIIINETSDAIHDEFAVVAIVHPLIYIYDLLNDDINLEEAVKYRSNGSKIFDLLLEDIPSVIFTSTVLSNDNIILGLLSLSISFIIIFKTLAKIYYELKHTNN